MRVIVIGAGIVGLAHAALFAKAGHAVRVLERGTVASGASVRNFGMVWPVGQSPDLYDLALRSREIWLEFAQTADFWIKECGSLHLIHEELEEVVVREFLAAFPNRGEWVSTDEVLSQVPLLATRAGSLRGALRSTTEASVDARVTAARFAAWLPTLGVEISWETQVAQIETEKVTLVSGEVLYADLIIVATGPDFHELFPAEFARLGLKRCRLQMMRFEPLGSARIGTHLCAGLTLRHYPGFRVAPSLDRLKAWQDERWPQQIAHGIHILISEQPDGTITIGDSHEYGLDFPEARSEEVDQAIIEAANFFFPLDQYQLANQWRGIYNTHDTRPYVQELLRPGIMAVNAFGTGMTLSFGLAEKTVRWSESLAFSSSER